LAGGSVTLGDVTIEATDTIENSINPNNPNLFLAGLATITRSDGTALIYNKIPYSTPDGGIERRDGTPLVINGSTQLTLDVRAGIDWTKLPGFPGNSIIGTVPPDPTVAAPTDAPNFAAPTSADIKINSINLTATDGLVLLTNQYNPDTSRPGGVIEVKGQQNSTNGSIFSPYSSTTTSAVIIDSRSSITTGNINARRSSVALSAVGNIQTGKINTGESAMTNNTSVELSSTAGNIVVSSIAAGANGVDIRASGLFQATGFNSESLRSNLLPVLGTKLREFLDRKGIAVEPNRGVELGFAQTLPISIIARPGVPSARPAGSLNAPISIRYGDASRTAVNDSITVFRGSYQRTGSILSNSRVLVQGGNAGFYMGPRVDRVIPGNDEFITRDSNGQYIVVQPNSPYPEFLVRNERYQALVFPSDAFPADASGTVGAIVIAAGEDNGFYGSTQNLAFGPVPVTPNPTNPATPTNPVIVTDPVTDPITPTNPAIVTDPITPTNPVIATNSSTSDTSNSTTTQTDTPPTELENKMQSDTSTTSSSVIGYTGNILDVSLDSVATSCHATELRVRSDGKIELLGSCQLREDEEPKKLSEVNLFDESFMNALFPEIQLTPLRFLGNNPEKLPTIRSQRF
jgi:hypothetical protein